MEILRVWVSVRLIYFMCTYLYLTVIDPEEMRIIHLVSCTFSCVCLSLFRICEFLMEHRLLEL
jgi:hypothetical protein